MAQKTWVAGDVVTAADTNTYLSGEGGAWTTWTPVVTQSGTVAATVNRATYGRWGRMIVATVWVTMTGTGTAANGVTVSLPVAAAGYVVGSPIGSGWLFDTSVGTTYPCLPCWNSASVVTLMSTSSGLGLGAGTFTAALAAGDQITFTVTYEAAS
jgi:hypothetical protein